MFIKPKVPRISLTVRHLPDQVIVNGFDNSEIDIHHYTFDNLDLPTEVSEFLQSLNDSDTKISYLRAELANGGYVVELRVV